jgi:hypothetical protein
MTKNLLITGAGVDRTPGIDFPLAYTLLPEVAQFIEAEGKEVDAALRSMLPNLRFSFNNLVARAVDEITTRGAVEQRAMIQRVQDAIKDLPPEKESVRKHGELLIRLFNKLAVITQEGELDDQTRALIREVFPADAEELMDSDSILDIHKLSLSDTFKAVLKRTLRLGLTSKRTEVATALGADMLNIEQLLIDKFLGFYNDKVTEIKNYIYISWVLWAYLVTKQQQVENLKIANGIPFYDIIPEDCHAITLNYTSFLADRLGRDRVIYFHGGLAEYVSMATRELIPIEDIHELNPAEFLKSLAENLNFDGEDVTKHKHVIPALVPPLRLKPILSHRYIEEWHRASSWVKQAEKIVVVGYSFNSADEHFNDILRQQMHAKELFVIGPGVHKPDFLKRMERVCSIPLDNLVSCKIQGLPAKKANHTTLIQATADVVNVNALFNF